MGGGELPPYMSTSLSVSANIDLCWVAVAVVGGVYIDPRRNQKKIFILLQPPDLINYFAAALHAPH